MPRRLVAIVGRPNVGKSTLFNRIVGQRSAIVHDLPGVTRDRHYADTDWAGKAFTIVDTGGFVPASEDVIEAAIREQAQIAIEEADLVMFVVDGTTGPVAADVEVAGILRRSGKKVLLVVNKIDSEHRMPSLAEFYALGLGEPFGVSALGGRLTGDLMDLITRDLPPAGDEDGDTRLKVAVIGKPNVGKSSFVNALLGENRAIVTEIPGTTRDPIDSVVRHHGEEIVLVDTAGLRRRGKIKESVEFYSAVRTLKSVERCDVAIVLLDAEEGLEHQDLRIVEAALERRRPVLLAVNKWDLLEKDSRTAAHLEKALKQRLRAYDYLPVVFISALMRQRIHRVLDLVKKLDAEQRRKISTSELNDQLGEDIRTYPPRSASGREIKIKYITQGGVKPPTFLFFCNDPRLVEENYRRYLENCIRRRFGFEGVPLVLGFKRK
jgi:GTP-binding protein